MILLKIICTNFLLCKVLLSCDHNANTNSTLEINGTNTERITHLASAEVYYYCLSIHHCLCFLNTLVYRWHTKATTNTNTKELL